MLEEMGGLTYAEISFDAKGNPSDPRALETSLQDLANANLKDVFIFSHGWNNSPEMARALYDSFFGQMSAVLNIQGLSQHLTTIGAIGVIWPSRRWSDEAPPGIDGGGAAGLGDAISDSALVRELADTFSTAQLESLEALADLLDRHPDDAASRLEFQRLMKTLVTSTDAESAPEDEGEADGLFSEDPLIVFERFAAFEQSEDGGGAAGLGDVVGKLWKGAKGALRQATYFEMKRRAGIVGKAGLGPVLGRLHEASPNLRMHLIGHSFGARLVAFSLAGIPTPVLAPGPSPVKSLTLIQGAFSHYAFSQSLPYDTASGGALAGKQTQVDGPVIVTHSTLDTALSDLYPLASLFGGPAAAAIGDLLEQWGAMGHRGAQASGEVEERLLGTGGQYFFQAGQICNLDSNAVIVNGSLPNGAHSDIVHPEVAWAILSAAQFTA